MARSARSGSTRTALLGVGARVFTRRKLYGATVREIVGETGSSAPLLYDRFRDKTDLYGEVPRAGEKRYAALVLAELGRAQGAVGSIHTIVRACAGLAEEDRSGLNDRTGRMRRRSMHESPRIW